MPMFTRVAGVPVYVTTNGPKFVVDAGPNYDVFQTANERGNFSKVIALNEGMRGPLSHLAGIDTDFPFAR